MIIFEHHSTGCCYVLLLCSMYILPNKNDQGELFVSRKKPLAVFIHDNFIISIYVVFNQYSDRSTCTYVVKLKLK